MRLKYAAFSICSTWTALAFLLISAPAEAGNWIVCDAQIEIIASDKVTLSATVRSTPSSNPAGCFKPGDSLQFSPETPDYQHMVPRKKWPQVGQQSRLRYRELSGLCKNDGATKPCTIRHYSILK